MSDINITIKGQQRLLTAGKYCDKNIVITAENDSIVLQEKSVPITQNTISPVEVTPDSGYDGLSKVSVTVNVPTGGDGECTATHVIEVEELPTENIDESAVYLCGGAYYKILSGFIDVIIYAYGSASGARGAVPVSTYNIVSAKPTEGILESNMDDIWHFYYVESESDIFIYSSTDGWTSLSALFGLSYGGVISNISEATADGYYAFIGTAHDKYFIPVGQLNIEKNGSYPVSEYDSVYVNVPIPDGYIKPTETWEITENGTHNVKYAKEVTVNVTAPTPHFVRSYEELPTDVLAGSMAVVLGGAQ